jgi:TRAP-type uncharacterized transport system substrate-binding protein
MASLNIQSRAMAAREYYRTHRLQFIILMVALAVAILWAVIAALRPMPPHTLTMATGPEGSAYHEFGKRYRDILAIKGVELRLVTTAGALENLAQLRDSRSNVDVGFLQSGTTSVKDSPDLESLGTVFYEPAWFFIRDVYRGKGKESFRGKKISIGPEGSSTRELALKLLALNGIDQSFADLLPLTHQEAGERLIRGEIDVAVMLAPWDDPVVQRLLTANGIELFSYPRADAISALHPYLTKLVLPEGVADLAMNRPSSNVFLFAPKAHLVVRGELHTALQYLLLDAAEQIHSRPGIFHKAGQFPAAEPFDLPLSEEARQFYKSGKPFFQRHLPFWLAVLLDRLLILLIPVVGVLYPLVQILPALYDKAMRQRIYRLYGELMFLENELDTHRADENRDDLNAKLDQLEKKVNLLQLPATYANLLYTLRDHIILVRGLIKGPQETPTAAEAETVDKLRTAS